jgi:hypothetical protein
MYAICLSNIINYQNVSITFAIISVCLQEYYEYNKLPNCICGITQHYNSLYMCICSFDYIILHIPVTQGYETY